MDKISIQHIDELLRFIPKFSSKDKFIREIIESKEIEKNVFTESYIVYSNDINDFINLISKFWNDYDYLTNITSSNLEDDDFIRKATISQIKSLLTYCWRSDRFCDGCLVKYFEDGKIISILERLLELRKDIIKDNSEIQEILLEAKLLSKRYKKLTGKPLGITGEVAEFSAAQKLNLVLAKARQTGYDAIKIVNGKEVKVQIKGRSISKKSKNGRLGKIRIDTKWDTVMLVLLDDDLEIINIYEADRDIIKNELSKSGSKSRNIRGALGISKFISISKKVY